MNASSSSGRAGREDRLRLLALVRALGIESDRLGSTFAAQQGLHTTDLQALLHVMESEARGRPLTAGQLGAALGLTSGATTGVIDRLARDGHLDRRRDDRDRRKVHLAYGESARAVAEDFFRPLERLSTAALSDFTAEEIDAAGRVLARLVEVFADYTRSVRAGEPG